MEILKYQDAVEVKTLHTLVNNRNNNVYLWFFYRSPISVMKWQEHKLLCHKKKHKVWFSIYFGSSENVTVFILWESSDQIQTFWRNKHQASRQIHLWSGDVYRREENSEVRRSGFIFTPVHQYFFINSFGSEQNLMWLGVFIPPEILPLHLTLLFFNSRSLIMNIFWFLSSSMTVIRVSCGQTETFSGWFVGFWKQLIY